MPEEDIPGVDDAREPGQDGQEDVDPEVNLEAAVQEDSQGRDENGKNEEDDVGSAEACLSDGGGGGYRLFVAIGACCGWAVGSWCCAGSGGSTSCGIGLRVCCARSGSSRGIIMGLFCRRVGDRGRCRVCL